MMDYETEFAITTFDNPFDPFEQFTQWFMYDVQHGYNTCGLLARFADTSDEMTQREVNAEIERAIDKIIFYDFRNVYKKVIRKSPIIEPMDLSELNSVGLPV